MRSYRASIPLQPSSLSLAMYSSATTPKVLLAATAAASLSSRFFWAGSLPSAIVRFASSRRERALASVTIGKIPKRQHVLPAREACIGTASFCCRSAQREDRGRRRHEACTASPVAWQP